MNFKNGRWSAYELKNKMDSIANATDKAIIQREKSQKIFLHQNEILEKSNELTQKQIEKEKPDVTVYTTNIKFSKSDSITTLSKIVFTNEGKRTASLFKQKIVWILKDKTTNQYIKPFYSPQKTSEIYPSNMLLVENFMTLSYDDFINKSSGGEIIVTFSYYDELIDDYKNKQLVFKILIENNNYKILKESEISDELINYLKTNKIDLSIE